MRAKVEVLSDVQPEMTPDFDMLVKSVRQAAERMVELSPNVPDEATTIIGNIDQPGMLADFLAANLSGDYQEKQSLLEEIDVTKRLERVREKLASRIELLELQEKIQTQVRSSIDKSQRTYYLQEQMKAIQKELGVDGGPEADVAELKRKLEEAKLPEPVKKETDRELMRLLVDSAGVAGVWGDPDVFGDGGGVAVEQIDERRSGYEADAADSGSGSL